MKVIFIESLFGGLLFILTALFLIHDAPGVKWYLIGMGQIMIVVGVMGCFILRKKKEVR